MMKHISKSNSKTSDSRKRTEINGASQIKYVGNVLEKEKDLSISELLCDKANLCTFIGTSLATLAIANIWKKRYFLASSMSALASLADILDGPIARSSRARRPPVCTVGKYLDTYSDVISHFVVPASLLMDMSDLNPVCVLLAAAFVCSGVLRHARHEIIKKLDGDSCIYGITSDYILSASVIVTHLNLVVETQFLSVIYSMVLIFFIFGSLSSSFRTRRYSGLDLAIVGYFHIWLALSSIFFRYILVSSKEEGSLPINMLVLQEYYDIDSETHCYGFTMKQLAVGFISTHMTFAYPCYYRFIERNVMSHV